MYPNNTANHQEANVCVNCGINLYRIKRKRLTEESQELQQLLNDWICKELEDNEAVCAPCYFLLHTALESENKSRKFGYKNIPSHQIKRLDIVCFKCFSKAKRVYEKSNSKVNSKVQKKRAKEKVKDIEVKIERLGGDELDFPASPDRESSEDEDISEKYPQPLSITLDDYKRTADTSSHCIFKNCRNSDRALIPKSIKERLLLDYSFYLPTHSRICKEHQINSHEVWRELVDNATITDFTAEHIENIFSILQNVKCNSYCKSFTAYIKKDDYLCKYLLGISYEKFEEMLNDMQAIKKRVWCVKKALAIYLMRKHTGFCVEKLAEFFGTRPRALTICHRAKMSLIKRNRRKVGARQYKNYTEEVLRLAKELVK
ncbi:hypothetical protein PYW07_010756 [Mythimna separata]|uniref:Uncharacterized protein n=1 Tax=Mythimna separata TaxID=271217 RepID=A0AAD8DL81_MYTSE|nr:hypothetical protein PYW07_010756 [Mythimna separata]